MFRIVITSVDAQTPLDDWAVYWQDENMASSQVSQGTWQDLPDVTEKHPSPCHVIVPGEWCLSHIATLPVAQQRHLNQSAMYHCEPLLGVDVGNVHVAYQCHGDDVLLVAIERALLDSLLNALRQKNYVAHHLTTDVAVMASNSTSNTLWISQQRFVASEPVGCGWAVESTHAGLYLQRWLASSAFNVNQRLNIITEENNSNTAQQQEIISICTQHGVSINHCNKNVSGACFEQTQRGAISLLQGDYERDTAEVRWRRWRPLTLTIAACALVITATHYWLAHNVTQQALQLKAEQRTLYTSLFPNDRRIVSLKRQFEAHMQTPVEEVTPPMIFLEAFGQFIATLPASDDTQGVLQHINFVAEKRQLQAGVLLPTVEHLETLTQSLRKAGLTANLQTANTTEQGANGEFAIGFPL